MMHHAYVVEGNSEEGIEAAKSWVRETLHMKLEQNPDILVRTYSLFSVEDARSVAALASGAPLSGSYKAIIVSVTQLYHEAQNALLKLFEEPPSGVFLFLILPHAGTLLPTLRSRIQRLPLQVRASEETAVSAEAQAFVKASKEKRSAIIKKLTSGTDDEDRRANRASALALLNGVEAVAYEKMHREENGVPKDLIALCEDVTRLRDVLQGRSAPLKMILEHLSLVTPKDLI